MTSDAVLLKAETREEFGSRCTEKLREKGKLPVIIYGHKQEPVAVTVNLHEFTEKIHHGQRLLNVEIQGEKNEVLVKDLQYDYLGKKIIHADMVRVNLTEKVKVAVPLEFKGVSAGSQKGGLLDEHLDHLEIECTVTQIPETIVVSVKGLDIGDNLHAGDIELGPGMKLVTAPSTLVIACHLPAVKEEVAATAEEEQEQSSEPEVITEKKVDNEQQE